jgi:surfeit locus 1 family protein
MLPNRPIFLALAVTIAGAALFARLGVWQLDRLHQRQAFNAGLHERLAATPLSVTSLPTDTAKGHYHRVVATGRFDYAAQVALAARSSRGSPGVHLLTPLDLDNGATVMVNRGWVYAPDGKTVDGAKWREREGETLTVAGYAETWPGRDTAPPSPGQRVVRALDSAAVARLVGRPILAYYVAQTSDSARSPDRPVRLGEPVLDDGSHFSYAVQWFSFAIIALIGGALLVREEFARRRASA